MTAWLLQQQSRVKQCHLHPDLRQLARSLSRASAVEFSRQLLSGWLKKPATKTVWVQPLAGALGGEAVVSELNRAVKKAAEGFKVKMGHWAIDSLLQIGSPAALSAVLDTAEKLKNQSRQKLYKIGAYANDAIESFAHDQGIQLDELADRCLPWLGFEPGKPRIIDAGKKTIAVTIGADYKLQFYDQTGGRIVKSIPKAAGDAAKAEFKATAALLRDVVKSQTSRLEKAMVSQRRWSLDAFQQRVLAHPLLSRMAAALIWTAGEGDEAVEFRPLDDGSLTSRDDEPVKLPGDGGVALLHPLNATAERREQWRQHLADYEVTPVFRQMERPVFQPESDEMAGIRVSRFASRSVNVMSLLSRTERLGWRRESLPGYNAEVFVKPQPGGDVEARLIVGGAADYFRFADPQAEATLGDIYWTPIQRDVSVSEAGALRVGETLPIAFSETLYDVQRIADGL